MSVWGWILIAAIVVILAVAVVAVRLAITRRRSERLREKFGPEYERTLSDAGDQRAAEADLAAREQKRKQPSALSLESGEKYAALANSANRIRRQPIERSRRCGPTGDRGHAGTWLSGRGLRSAGG